MKKKLSAAHGTGGPPPVKTSCSPTHGSGSVQNFPGLLHWPFCSSRRDAGQSIIESAFVMIVLCLILFGCLQLSRIFAAREILEHSAQSAARARAVGFNDFMVYKVSRVATIPNAGLMTTPQVANTSGRDWGSSSVGDLWDYSLTNYETSPQLAVERARIPLFLESVHPGELLAILDYADWETVNHPGILDAQGIMTGSSVSQEFPLRIPFRAAFYADDFVTLRASAWQGAHSELYLQ